MGGDFREQPRRWGIRLSRKGAKGGGQWVLRQARVATLERSSGKGEKKEYELLLISGWAKNVKCVTICMRGVRCRKEPE